MDISRSAIKTGLSVGPTAKCVSFSSEEQNDQDSILDKRSSDDVQSECLRELLDLDDCKDADLDTFPTDRGGDLLPHSHLASYAGNGCGPSLESFMFPPTPGGSQLCPWMTQTDSRTSTDDISDTEKNPDDDPRSVTPTNLSRKDLLNLRYQNALRALSLERELAPRTQKTATLLICYPDPPICSESVCEYSRSIRDVIFPSSVAPRCCLVHLKPGSNVEQTIQDINRIRFGQGHLHAELKVFTDEEQARCIDPCSLYVSNLPIAMSVASIKQFLKCSRVEIGVMKRNRRARYAFARYANADLAMGAFRDLVNTMVNKRVLTVRYRRQRKRLMFQSTSWISTAPTNPVADAVATTDDDAAECRVISPPPVESITILDSDDSFDGQSSVSHDHTPHKKRKSSYDSLSPSVREIQKIKQKMAEHEAIIRSLQRRQNSMVTTKEEPDDGVATMPLHRTITLCSSYEIKMENEYLGIIQSSPEPEPESGDHNKSQGGIERPNKSLGRLKSRSIGGNTTSNDHVDGLLTQLEKNLDS